MSTYASLTQDLQDWSENDDTEFTSETDNIIALAEERIYSDVPLHPAFKATNTGSLVAGTSTLTVPTGIRSIRSFAITVSSMEVFLEQRTDMYLEDYWPNSTQRDIPKFYTRQSEIVLKMAPTPISAFAYTVNAYELPTALSSGNTSTWISTNKANLLLNASMVEAMKFMKNTEKRTEWEEDYQTALKPFLAEMVRDISNENTTGV